MFKQFFLVMLSLAWLSNPIAMAGEDSPTIVEKKQREMIEEMEVVHDKIISMNASIEKQLMEIYLRFEQLSLILADRDCAQKKVAISSLDLEIKEYEKQVTASADTEETLTLLESIKNKLALQYKTDCEDKGE